MTPYRGDAASQPGAANSLAGSVETLLLQTSGARAAFDEWAGASRGQLDGVEARHRAQLAQATAEASAIEARVGEAEARGSSFATTAAAHAAAVAGQRAALASLEGTLNKLPAQAAEAMAKRDAAAAAVAAAEKAKSVTRRSLEDQLNELTKGVLMYKFLGLEFMRAEDDRLSIKFTHLDPEDWEREFSFLVSLGADDAYRVDGCTPQVEPASLAALLAQLNAPNEEDPMEFPGFVVEMRRRFAQLVR